MMGSPNALVIKKDARRGNLVPIFRNCSDDATVH